MLTIIISLLINRLRDKYILLGLEIIIVILGTLISIRILRIIGKHIIIIVIISLILLIKDIII